jgi:hypothetical protein
LNEKKNSFILFLDLEWHLGQLGAVDSELEEDPRKNKPKLTTNYVNRSRYGDRDDNSDED